jgi:hypothetical protein
MYKAQADIHSRCSYTVPDTHACGLPESGCGTRHQKLTTRKTTRHTLVIGQLALASVSLPLPQEPNPQPPKIHGAMPPRARTRGRHANPPRIASANAINQPHRRASQRTRSHQVASRSHRINDNNS